jgi:hypothetical protein
MDLANILFVVTMRNGVALVRSLVCRTVQITPVQIYLLYTRLLPDEVNISWHQLLGVNAPTTPYNLHHRSSTVCVCRVT